MASELRSSGARHDGPVFGPGARDDPGITQTGGRTRAASSRARETTAAAGTRGKREWGSCACEVGGAADEAESPASSASPARSGHAMQASSGPERTGPLTCSGSLLAGIKPHS
jgi:hypothetical protein